MAYFSTEKIRRAQFRLDRRLIEIEDHFHVKRQFCECCRRSFTGEIGDHLKEEHDLKCDRCPDFDTVHCPYRSEVATVWKVI